jgi:uncharacterized protein YegJ (DUF2314 family)
MIEHNFTTFGNQARVEVSGKEVILTFTADNPEMADKVARSIAAELKRVAIDITMVERPEDNA